MAVGRNIGSGWLLSVEPVGAVDTFLPRLLAAAQGGPVGLGVDFPVGLPRAYVRLHAGQYRDFPSFLTALTPTSPFFDVADTVVEIGATRPFYPRRGQLGMTRLAHAQALGFASATELSRACDRATPLRPAGAPLFWTLGANQTGKAAIAAWRDLLLPARAACVPLSLWPFEGPFAQLLQPGRIALAETYPADAQRQAGIRFKGSKRRQADRQAVSGQLFAAMEGLQARPGSRLSAMITDGFHADAAGEDRFDCLLGLLCVIGVMVGRRRDSIPADPWIRHWEGWVLGQADPDDQPA